LKGIIPPGSPVPGGPLLKGNRHPCIAGDSLHRDSPHRGQVVVRSGALRAPSGCSGAHSTSAVRVTNGHDHLIDPERPPRARGDSADIVRGNRCHLDEDGTPASELCHACATRVPPSRSRNAAISRGDPRAAALVRLARALLYGFSAMDELIASTSRCGPLSALRCRQLQRAVSSRRQRNAARRPSLPEDRCLPRPRSLLR